MLTWKVHKSGGTWTAKRPERRGHTWTISKYPDGTFSLASRGAYFGRFSTLEDAMKAAETAGDAHAARFGKRTKMYR